MKPPSGRRLIFLGGKYAFASQAALHGRDPKDVVLEIHPRVGEHTLRLADILSTIKREGQTIALVLLSGVQYYTGQWFPIETITRAAHEQVRWSFLADRMQIVGLYKLTFAAPVFVPGLYLCLGPRTRDRKRPHVTSRMGRRFRSLVLVQISQFGSRRYRWTVCP